MARPQKSLHIDATYKIVNSRFPIMICGFSDPNHRFFPVFLALSSNEDGWAYTALLQAAMRTMTENITIIGDAAKPITAACEANELRRATCWFHCKQAAKKRMLKKEFDWGPVNSGLNLLQLSANEQEFFTAARLLDQQLASTEWANPA